MKFIKLKTAVNDGRPDVVAIPINAITEVRYVYGGENCGECYVNGKLYQASFNDVIAELEKA